MRGFAERYTAAWCGRDPNAVAAFFAPDGALAINDGAPARGRDAIAGVANDFMIAFPDLEVRMDDLVEHDGKVIYRWTLIGTNSGPGGSGDHVQISGSEEWSIDADGLIEASRGRFDAAEYQRQVEGGVQR